MKIFNSFNKFIFLLLFLPMFCIASTQLDVRVKTINGAQDIASGVVYFQVENTVTRTTLPSCVGSSYPDYWMLTGTPNSDVFKAQVSMLLTSYSQGRPILIFGTGQCVVGIETVTTIGLR